MTDQERIKLPPPGDKGGGLTDLLSGQTQEVKIPETEDILKKIDNAIKAKRAPATCCGTLPCKGRKAACFSCDICLDCITGRGCGHDPSRHKPHKNKELGHE